MRLVDVKCRRAIVLHYEENLLSQGIRDFKMIVEGGSHIAKGEVTAK